MTKRVLDYSVWIRLIKSTNGEFIFLIIILKMCSILILISIIKYSKNINKTSKTSLFVQKLTSLSKFSSISLLCREAIILKGSLISSFWIRRPKLNKVGSVWGILKALFRFWNILLVLINKGVMRLREKVSFKADLKKNSKQKFFIFI